MIRKPKKLTSTAAYSITDARNSKPAYPGTRNTNEFLTMTLGERAFIARYIVKEFSPTDAKEPSAAFKKKYSREWWETKVQYVNGKNALVNGDTAHFILNACLFPERSQEDWQETDPSPVEFYETVSYENALGWYMSCPAHLCKRIVDEIAKFPAAVDSKPGEPVYDAVKRKWGDRPTIHYVDEPGFGKELTSHYIELELFNQWVSEYEKEVIRQAVLSHGSQIQNERRALNAAMGLNVDSADLPSQADGLDPTQAATVRWLQMSGEMPLEYLARTYRDEEAKPSDRLNAAKTLMDFVHRRIPAKQEIETVSKVPKLNPSVLSGLTSKELETLEKLLAKLSDGE